MKFNRSLSIILAALAVPVAAFAADSAVSSVSGGVVTARVNGRTVTIPAGAPIPAGAMVKSTGKLGVKLPDGTTAYFSPGSTFRLSQNTDGSVSVTLLTGAISGTFPAGFTVVTSGGTVSLGGSTASVGITPSGNGGGGALAVAVTAGTAPTITPPAPGAAVITVATGTQVSVAAAPAGAAPSVTTVTLTPAQVSSVNSAVTGVTSAPAMVTSGGATTGGGNTQGQTGGTQGQTGNTQSTNTTLPNISQTNVASPNGEGQNT